MTSLSVDTSEANDKVKERKSKVGMMDIIVDMVGVWKRRVCEGRWKGFGDGKNEGVASLYREVERGENCLIFEGY